MNSGILVNKAQCLLCKQILISASRHDFNTCKCGNLSVDGGQDYLKRSAGDFTTIVELSEYEQTSENFIVS